MRLAVFSDIHSNIEALEAFINDALQQDISHFFCLGDIVGYGANPNKSISMLQSLPGLKCVLGNHDHYASKNTVTYDMNLTAARAIIWTRKKLSRYSIKFLKALKPALKTSTISFTHAAPYNPLKWQYIFTSESASRSFFRTRKKVIFNGHTHLPQIITQKHIFKIDFETPESNKSISINHGKRIIVNCGSIGQSRDGDPRASYVIYDMEKETLEFRRIAYDHQSAAKKIIAAGLPKSLAERLAKGR